MQQRTKSHSGQIAPYRLLFPVGLIFGLIGVGMWILVFNSLGALAPVVAHSEIMIGGFLGTFALGFLMTALPRLTQSKQATKLELRFVSLIVIAMFSGTFFSAFVFHLATLALYLFLVSFALRRLINFKGFLPPFFYFVGFGVFSAVIGAALLLFLGETHLSYPALERLSRLLFLQAAVLNFVIGIGSFLVPAILGLGPLPLSSAMTAEFSRKRHFNFPLIIAIVFNVVLWIDAIHPSAGARAVRALLFSVLAFGVWRIHKRPAIRGILQFGIRLSGFSFVAAQWAYLFFFDYASHVLHLMFISGFSLLTFLVASRVTLAHGHGQLHFERNDRFIYAFIIFNTAAAAGRILAAFFPVLFGFNTLVLAAALWITSACFWTAFFIKHSVLMADPTKKSQSSHTHNLEKC